MTKPATYQFWMAIHRYLGLATLAFLFLAAVTGSVLCFGKPIDAALNSDLFSVADRSPAIDPVEAVARYERANPGVVVLAFPLAVPPGRTILANVAARAPGASLGYDEVFLDPHDGHPVGTRHAGPGWDRRHIVQGIFAFHYTLLAADWGRWLMGIAAIGWLAGNVIGAWLTFPVRGPFWKQWKAMWTVDFSARLRRLMVALHRSSGLWLFPLVLVLAATSVAMNFFDEAFTPAVEAVSPARKSPFDEPQGQSVPAPRIGFAQARAAAQASAKADGNAWLPAKASFIPERDIYGVMFTHSGVENYAGLGPVTYYFSGEDGRQVYVDDPYTDSAGRKLSRSLYPLHSGEVFGLIGVLLIFLAGLGTAEMCVTGFYTWWKKRASKKAMAVPRKAA